MQSIADHEDWPVFRAFILSLADDEYIVGHHLGKWLAVSPTLEEDNALTSIAQDELGHARLWYDLVADGLDRDTDALAIERLPSERRNSVMVERPHADFADTITRQFLYDSAEELLLESIADGTVEPAAEIATVALQEEPFHLEHAANWLDILTATDESLSRLNQQFERNLALARDLFAFPDRDELRATGILSTPIEEVEEQWQARVRDTLDDLDIGLDGTTAVESHEKAPSTNGRLGEHSAEFETVIDRMQPAEIDQI